MEKPEGDAVGQQLLGRAWSLSRAVLTHRWLISSGPLDAQGGLANQVLGAGVDEASLPRSRRLLPDLVASRHHILEAHLGEGTRRGAPNWQRPLPGCHLFAIPFLKICFHQGTNVSRRRLAGTWSKFGSWL